MNRFNISFGLITILGWLLFFTFPLLLVDDGKGSGLSLLSSPYYWRFCLFFFLLFYVNAKFLTPFLLLKKKLVLYILSVLLLLVSVYFLRPFDNLLHYSQSLRYIAIPLSSPGDSKDDRPPREKRDHVFTERNKPPGGPPPAGEMRTPPLNEPQGPQYDITSLFIFIVVMTLSTATEAMQRWQITERRAARAETEKAKAELSFLKAQINPHFLFNTLNNIYALALSSHEKTADSIMKLSNIMRFVTDDVKTDKVSLSREVECIQDYIDLQKLRLGKSADITFEVTGNTALQSISPMILLTFVENAFKHGISKRNPSPVVISIDASPERIYFYCQNRYFNHQTSQERNGIGIDNTKQRLRHVYPQNHHLTIHKDESVFAVTLEINVA